MPDSGDQQQPLIEWVLGWLTAGYPDGIPSTDQFAVIALLKRRLSDEQVRAIVRELTDSDGTEPPGGPIDQAEAERLIHRVLGERPSDSDIHRVSARLAAGGWPLAESLEIAAGQHWLDDRPGAPAAG